MSAARDRLAVRKSIACSWCGTRFVPVARPGGRGHRYCSKRCRMDAENAAKRISDAGGKRPETLAMPFPVTELEAVPWEVWIFGLCVILPEGKRHYWTSDDEADIIVAKAYRRACPARAACAAWAVRNLPRRDDTVWGGLDGTDRRRLRRAMARDAPLSDDVAGAARLRRQPGWNRSAAVTLASVARKCARCGTQLKITARRDALYCSGRCRMDAYRVWANVARMTSAPRTCQACGGWIGAWYPRSDRRYCSGRCRTAAWRERRGQIMAAAL